MKIDKILCPNCNSLMQLKKAYKGKNAGGQFYGCTRFPRCRGTRPYDHNTSNGVAKSIQEKPKLSKTSSLQGTKNTKTVLKEETKNKFLSLIKYYRECVQIESLNEIELYASEENKDFVQCPQDKEWLASGKEKYTLESDDSHRSFGKNLRWKGRQANYYYAYPIYVNQFVRKDSGEKSASLLPVLIFPVTIERNADNINIKRSGVFSPQINARVFNKRNVASRPEQKRYLVQKMLEGWNDNNTFEVNLNHVIGGLKEELGIDVFVDPKLDTLSSNIVNIEKCESGFYAVGMLFASQGSSYTYGLEEELGEIEKMLATSSSNMPIIEALLERREPSLDQKIEKTQLD